MYCTVVPSISGKWCCTRLLLRIICSNHIWIVTMLPLTARCSSDVVLLYEDHLILPFVYIYLQLDIIQ